MEESEFRRQPDAVLLDLGPDAVSMPPRIDAKVGRDAIRAELSVLLAEDAPRHQSELEDLIIDGDFAIERAL